MTVSYMDKYKKWNEREERICNACLKEGGKENCKSYKEQSILSCYFSANPYGVD